MQPSALLRKLVPVLYEDDLLVAVAKPAGIDVGRAPGQEAAGLVDLLNEQRGEHLLVCNRLSRYDSGVLLLARTGNFLRHLRTGLRTGHVDQEFAAVAYGRMKTGTMVIGRHAGTSRGKGRGQRGAGGAPAATADPSRTKTLVQRLRQGERRVLISCRTTVDSTHSLLAQLRSEGLRVLGDRIGRGEAKVDRHDARHLHLAKIAFFHPEQKRKLSITAALPPGFDQAVDAAMDVTRKLHAALAHRLPIMAGGQTDAYRLVTGWAEGVPGIVFERYADVGVMQVHEGQSEVDGKELRRLASWYRKTLDLRAVYLKRFVKDRTAQPDVPEELFSPEPLVGEPVEQPIVIHENGLKFAIRPYDGYSVGLFPDQRDNRGRIREMSAGKDVLNLFAYTCGFSVAAAAGGAKSTVSVDLSPRPLEWGRENFALNELPVESHEFVRAEAMDYLPRAKKHERAFDVIVIDAPTFARGRKKGTTFAIKDDLPALVAAAADVLRPGGVMLVSSNARQMTPKMLIDRVRAGARGRKMQVVETPALPVDFDVDRDHAKSVIVRLA